MWPKLIVATKKTQSLLKSDISTFYSQKYICNLERSSYCELNGNLAPPAGRNRANNLTCITVEKYKSLYCNSTTLGRTIITALPVLNSRCHYWVTTTLKILQFCSHFWLIFNFTDRKIHILYIIYILKGSEWYSRLSNSYSGCISALTWLIVSTATPGAQEGNCSNCYI